MPTQRRVTYLRKGGYPHAPEGLSNVSILIPTYGIPRLKADLISLSDGDSHKNFQTGIPRIIRGNPRLIVRFSLSDGDSHILEYPQMWDFLTSGSIKSAYNWFREVKVCTWRLLEQGLIRHIRFRKCIGTCNAKPTDRQWASRNHSFRRDLSFETERSSCTLIIH